MNNISPHFGVDMQDDSIESLKATLQKLTEENKLLEQNYQNAMERCNALEREASALAESQLQTAMLAEMETKVHTLKKISACMNESLAHSWSISNNLLFKLCNKATQVIERSSQTKLHSIMEPLDRANGYLNDLLQEYYRSVMPKPAVSEALNFDTLSQNTQNQICSALENEYSKFDVLVFGTIDYDYLYQRPQHFADYFAAQGHRVFYINASFHHGYDFRINEKKENLYLVTLPCFSSDAIYAADLSHDAEEVTTALNNLLFHHCIVDAVMIADHPNWIHTMLPLKQNRGYRLITDYMDDFSGFENEEQDLVVQSCRLLLNSSDLVVASSLYLVEKASQFNPNVALIRNGTEFSHFHKAYKQCNNSARKVIGYYGVISSWFDYKKIKYLSARFPQHDIVLIGDVLESKRKFFEPLSNVQLCGVKPYTILPEYLKTFDVCLIPFDSSLDLIKATNPVKFYEYLSAAKKVVATEMPELEPFKNKFVYLANDDKTFGDYVELCLTGKDSLASPEECMQFARENDWEERSKNFSECVKAQFANINVILDDCTEETFTKCKKHILNNTAYPNYNIYNHQNTSADVLSDCDYVVYVQPEAVFSRGWLTMLSHQLAVTSAKAVCPVSSAWEEKSHSPLSAHMYLQAAKSTFYAASSDTSASDACIMLSKEDAQSLGLLHCRNPIEHIKQSGLNTAAVNTVISKY